MERRTIYTLTVMCFSILILAVSIQAQAQSAISDDLTGYVLTIGENGLELHAVTASGEVTGEVISLSQFTVEGQQEAEWNITDRQTIALSPDRRHLSFIAVRDEVELALLIYDLQTNSFQPYTLAVPIEAHLEPIWSPNSSSILLSGGISSQVDTMVFDLVSGQFTTVIDTYNIGLKWLPDSDHFIYIGPAVCGEPCQADNDLYVGDRFGLNTRALTTLDTNALGLSDQMSGPYIGIGNFVWLQNQQRIYMEVGEPPDLGRLELLYSVDLSGNLRFEADIAAIYPNSDLSTEIIDFFTSASDDSI